MNKRKPGDIVADILVIGTTLLVVGMILWNIWEGRI